MLNSLSPLQAIEIVSLMGTTVYHQIASYVDRQHASHPGKLLTTSDGKIRHLQVRGTGDITVVVDTSLGGVEGYLLIDELAKLTRVCIYDRSGYGWSDLSVKPRTSQQIVNELHKLLHVAQIPPPYILVGDSFGSYNMRLYAHQYPELVEGLVLTDGLHEDSMLSLPLSVGLLKIFFTGIKFLSLPAADRVRDRIHLALLKLSTKSQQILANNSSDFVWIDQPDIIIKAVTMLLDRSLPKT